MGVKMCPKIILEPTQLTMKTETAFALNEHPRIIGPRKYRYHSHRRRVVFIYELSMGNGADQLQSR